MRIDTNTTTVTTAGTAVQIKNTEEKVVSITIMGHDGNTDRIWIGVSDVAADAGFPVAAGETHTYNFPDDSSIRFSLLFIDADVSGEKANWSAILDE